MNVLTTLVALTPVLAVFFFLVILPASLSRVAAGVFLPIIKPPLTGPRPPEEALANEAVQHTPVHYSEGGGSLFDYQMAHFSTITTPLVSPKWLTFRSSSGAIFN